MSNLASMIMEGATFGGIKANLKHSYGHEDGAGLIAMESAEALRDIFEAVFYVPNTCTIAATLEGASCVEESTQAAIMEASVKGAFAKIKEFFINLKEKVKEFIHNIKRYLTGIFSNDEKWVKEYEKEIMAISASDLKDYEVKMYDYSNVDTIKSKTSTNAKYEAVIAETNVSINHAITKYEVDDIKSAKEADEDAIEEEFDKIYLDHIRELTGDKTIEADDLDKAIWSYMRNGADDESDKKEIPVAANRKKFIDTLKGSTKELSTWDAIIQKTDKTYKKAIDLVDKSEKEFANLDVKDGMSKKVYYRGEDTEKGKSTQISKVEASNIALYLRKMSSMFSKMQTAENKFNTAAKSALVERNKAYKAALTGVFSYAKKHKGGK